MKLGYMILHTGSPYLFYALKSIINQVDHVVIFYASSPSQGFDTDMPCPDTKQALIDLAWPYSNRLIWIDGEWGNEGDHTNAVFDWIKKNPPEKVLQFYPDGGKMPEDEEWKWLVRFDADEIFPDGIVDEMIAQAEQTEAGLFQFPFVHFWQNFNQVCRDAQYPYRMVRMNDSNESKILDSKDGKWTVYHFGYCVPNVFMQYKWEVTGHKTELRPEWFGSVWNGDCEKDLHPVSRGLWPEAQPFDKYKLPEYMRGHPYFHCRRVS